MNIQNTNFVVLGSLVFAVKSDLISYGILRLAVINASLPELSFPRARDVILKES
jgi:hypothetical protein